jgi:3-oxoacyl-[acyl-carrier-protein] synthase-3
MANSKHNSHGKFAPAQRYAHIVGWGMHVPETVLSNEDLEAILETNDEWITSRTGIKERRIANEHETTATLGLAAAKKALNMTHILPSDIDLIIVATSTPENIFPSSASLIQHWLGASKAGAFDLSAACSGFVYGIEMATQSIRSGGITTALVIGSETMSRVMDWQDRTTCILFGDGAGAVVLEASDEPGGVLSAVLRSDGSGYDLLGIPSIGNTEIRSQDSLSERKLHKMYMSGGEVFKFATRVIGESIHEALKKANVSLDDVKLIIPHQANQRIIQAAARSLRVDPDLFMSNLRSYGNTSAASVPIALAEAVEQNRIHYGDYIVLVGFGGGLTWGSVVIQWTSPASGEQPGRIVKSRRNAGYFFIRTRVRFKRLDRSVRESSRRFWQKIGIISKDDSES